MKVITFAIQKGGTGKTSTAVSVAVELAEKGHSVICLLPMETTVLHIHQDWKINLMIGSIV